jgi:hypothetical protein
MAEDARVRQVEALSRAQLQRREEAMTTLRQQEVAGGGDVQQCAAHIAALSNELDTLDASESATLQTVLLDASKDDSSAAALAAIKAAYAMEMAALDDRLLSDRERQRQALQEKLAARQDKRHQALLLRQQRELTRALTSEEQQALTAAHARELEAMQVVSVDEARRLSDDLRLRTDSDKVRISTSCHLMRCLLVFVLN